MNVRVQGADACRALAKNACYYYNMRTIIPGGVGHCVHPPRGDLKGVPSAKLFPPPTGYGPKFLEQETNLLCHSWDEVQIQTVKEERTCLLNPLQDFQIPSKEKGSSGWVPAGLRRGHNLEGVGPSGSGWETEDGLELRTHLQLCFA